MKNTPHIKYTPMYTPEDLRERLVNLSEALSEALKPLQYLCDCGAPDIADEEACYVQEMRGFVDLVKLVGEEELTEAIRSVNKACWEIQVANEASATDVEHPWFGEEPGGNYGTEIFFPETDIEFGSYAHGPTPLEEEEEKKRQANEKSQSFVKPSNTWGSDFSDF